MNKVINIDGLESFTGEIRKNEPLKFHTGLRIGGVADLFLIPKRIDDLRLGITWALKRHIPYRIIGNGTSIIANPDGYKGCIIKLANVLNHIQIKGNKIYAGAGATMNNLLRQAVNYSLSGLEHWWGIPATIGGWLIQRGLSRDPDLDHLIQEVYIMESDGLITRWIEPSQLFTDDVANSGYVVVEVVFNLKHRKKEEIIEKINQKQKEWDFIRHMNLPMAGPCFLSSNPDLTQLFVDLKLSGLIKGQAAFLGVGNGYVANLGEAAYDDVIELLHKIKERLTIRKNIFGTGLDILESRGVVG